MTIVEAARSVTGGVDTHGEVHVCAALDEVGGLLGTESFDATPDGYSALLSWLAGFGRAGKVGVEGTGSYGAGLARFLARAGVEVIEVDRHNRQDRRRQGKSDPIDAVQAARAALSGRAHGQAKSRDGAVEAIRVLVVAKRSATSGPSEGPHPNAPADLHGTRPAPMPDQGPAHPEVRRRGKGTAADAFGRPGDGSHQSRTVVAGPPHR